MQCWYGAEKWQNRLSLKRTSITVESYSFLCMLKHPTCCTSRNGPVNCLKMDLCQTVRVAHWMYEPLLHHTQLIQKAKLFVWAATTTTIKNVLFILSITYPLCTDDCFIMSTLAFNPDTPTKKGAGHFLNAVAKPPIMQRGYWLHYQAVKMIDARFKKHWM